MAFLIALLLVVLTISVLLYPFVKLRRRGDGPRLDDSFLEASSQRGAIYEEIRALQLERDLGRISEEEYQQRLQRYRVQAAASLREEGRLKEESGTMDQVLEEEVREARKRHAKDRSSELGDEDGL